MRYKYDPKLHRNTGGYRDHRGRIISRDSVMAEIGRYIDKQRIRDVTRRLQNQELSIGQWESTMREMIKDGHANAVMAEVGGRENMTRADWLRAGRHVKREYSYLSQWSRELASGQAPTDGRMLSRSDLYGEAVYITHMREVAMTMDGSSEYTQERSILDSGVEAHCHSCIEEANKGWVQKGSLKPIGSRDCFSRDRCRMTYR